MLGEGSEIARVAVSTTGLQQVLANAATTASMR